MTSLRQKQKLLRRQMIETAASELFEKDGFIVTTIEDIAQHAVVSPATVYNYYGNKSELLLALVAKGEVHTREQVLEFEERAKNEPPEVLLAEIVCSNMANTLKYMSRELWGHVVAYVATTPDPDVAKRYLASITDDLAKALAVVLGQYVSMGTLNEVDVEHFAYMMTRLERNHFLVFIYLQEMSVDELYENVRKDVALLVKTLSVGR